MKEEESKKEKCPNCGAEFDPKGKYDCPGCRLGIGSPMWVELQQIKEAEAEGWQLCVGCYLKSTDSPICKSCSVDQRKFMGQPPKGKRPAPPPPTPWGPW